MNKGDGSGMGFLPPIHPIPLISHRDSEQNIGHIVYAARRTTARVNMEGEKLSPLTQANRATNKSPTTAAALSF
jgi:hypothetical protein